MKILSLAFSLGGGGGQVLAGLVRGIPEHHQIGIVQDDPVYYTGVEKLLQDAGFPVHRINPENARNWIRRLRPDLVVYHWWPLLSGEFTAESLQAGVPRLLVSHYTREVPPGFDFYVSVSRHGLSYLQGIPPSRVEVIYNGIDPEDFHRPRLDHEGFIIGRVSSLEEKKIPRDHLGFLATLAIPGVKFVLIGDGNRRPPLLEEARRLGGDKFLLPGRLDNEEVREWLRKFDLSLYVTDTHLESHSISLLEKMASGVPIVAEPRGGIPEQVFHGENGLLAGEPAKLRYYCELLAREPRLRAEFSENGRRIVKEKFSRERMLAAYRELFRRIVYENSFFNRLLNRWGRPKDHGQSHPGDARA